jgi:hypothetical protein
LQPNEWSTDVRAQPFPRSLGIERTEQQILVCKAEMRRKFIDVDAPRLTPQVLARLRYSGSVARYFRWTDI